MSRVIKNNDGVAIVEGTPAASLVKDVDKFFAAKPPERMAGESFLPRRTTMLTERMRNRDGNKATSRKSIEGEFSMLAGPAAIKEATRIDSDTKSKPAENFLDFYKSQSSPIFDGKGNVIGYKDGSKGTTEMFDKPIPREEYKGPVSDKPTDSKKPVEDKPTDSKKPVEDKRRFTGGSKDFNERTGRVEPGFRDSPQRKPQSERTDEERRANLEAFDRLSEERKRGMTINTKRPQSNRSEARDKAESRRKNFFQRRRSKKEAMRSEREQQATRGKFITTLGR